MRSGIRVAIFGPPNAGKSSFLNCLARREVAIVSPIAGTTRDVIDVNIDVGGYPVMISDTAGMRDSTDPVEIEGIKRAKKRVEDCDIGVCILDASSFARDLSTVPDMIESAVRRNSFIILNKSDLLREDELAYVRRELHCRTQLISPDFEFHRKVKNVSCVREDGIADFMSDLSVNLEGKFAYRTDAGFVITQSRHRNLVQQADSHLGNFLDQLIQGHERIVLAAEELRAAVQCIGKLTGRVDVEEVLDHVFKDFCIGK